MAVFCSAESELARLLHLLHLGSVGGALVVDWAEVVISVLMHRFP